MVRNEITIYETRGLRWGSPGTVEWIKNTTINDFWSLKHVYLALGALLVYEEVYGLDPALVAEKHALKEFQAELDPKVKSNFFGDWYIATSYVFAGMKHIARPQ